MSPAAVETGPIVGLDVAICAIPMPHPVVIGQAVYTQREYVVLRIRTQSGLLGTALGHARNVPSAAALEQFAPEMIGSDALMRGEIVARLKRANPSGIGSLVRALSLIDIALWDIQARAAQQPLYRLLGGVRRRVRLCAVGGYFTANRSVGDVEDEIRRLADSGYRHVKVHIEGTQPAADAAYVQRLQCAAGSQASLSVDAHGGWLNLVDALSSCRRLDDLGLGFIEDPFPPERWRWMQELQGNLRTPLAAGEDVLHLAEFHNLIESVMLLRIDATASGGFTDVLQASAVAATRGRAVMTHAFPDLHAQLAGGVSTVDLVEIIPYESGANPVGELLVNRQAIDTGEMILSDEPGHGFQLDWEAVTTRAKTLKTIDTDGA